MQRLVLVGTLSVVLLAGSAQAVPSPWTFKQAGAKETLKIGAVVPLDGDRTQQGAALLAAIQLAVKENAPKVLPGFNIEVVPANGKCEAATAKPAAAKLVSDGAVGIIGEVCSSASTGIIEATSAKKVPVISPGSTSPSLSTADNFFRTIPSDAFQGVALADAIKAAGGASIALVYEDDLYGSGLIGKFKPAFTGAGGKVAAEYKFAHEQGKGQEAVDKIKAAKPDAVLLVTNDLDFAADFLKKSKAAGVTAKIFGGDSLVTPGLVSALGGTTNALANFAATSMNPGTANFRKRFDTYTKNAAFDPYAAAAYDGTVALLNAIRAAQPAKPSDGGAVIAQLQKAKFDGVTGPVSFDASGDRVASKGTYVLNKYDSGSKAFKASN